MKKFNDSLQKFRNWLSSYMSELTGKKILGLILLLTLVLTVGCFITINLPYIIVGLIFICIFLDFPTPKKPTENIQPLQIKVNWLASLLYRITAEQSNELGIVGNANDWVGNVQLIEKKDGVKMFILSFAKIKDETEIDLESVKKYLNRIIVTKLNAELYENIDSLYIDNIPKIQLTNVKDNDSGVRQFYIVQVERREDANKYFR